MIDRTALACRVLNRWLPLAVLGASVTVLLSTMLTAAFAYEVTEFRCGPLPPEIYPLLDWIFLLIPQSTGSVIFSGLAHCFRGGPGRHLLVALGGSCLVWWLYNAAAVWGGCPAA